MSATQTKLSAVALTLASRLEAWQFAFPSEPMPGVKASRDLIRSAVTTLRGLVSENAELAALASDSCSCDEYATQFSCTSCKARSIVGRHQC